MSIGRYPDAPEGVTKQVLRLSLTRLINLSAELARAHGGRPVAVGAGRPVSELVSIRETNDSRLPPLVLVHPVGGSVIAYYPLAKALRADRSVYAIENQVAFNPEARLHRTIEAMAAAYLELIQSVRRDGPYLLGGYSMGGLVAFEMARQLMAQEHRVQLLAIIDTPARVLATAGDDNDQGLTPREVLTMATIIGRQADRHLGIKAKDLEHLSPDERVARLIEALRSHGLIPHEADEEVFSEIVAAIRRNDLAQRRYLPHPYGGDVDLLRASRSSSAFAVETGALYDDPSLGWQEVCTRPVRVSHVPGTHLRLMDHPYVQGVGTWLQERIDDTAVAVA